MEKVHSQLDDIVGKLKERGFNQGNSTEEYLHFLWDLYQVAERNLQITTNSLEELKEQQAEEMKEVESYVAHIRSLTEEREALTTDFEKENIQLRMELEKLQIQQESQLKEVEEMLDQEGLNEIAQSSPSEQIAYLLVERATLLEKLEALEQKMELDNRSDVNRQDELEQIHRTLEEELYQQCESMRRTKETLSKTFDEELNKEKKMREYVERDLTEAALRLKMAHDEIRKLTDDLIIKGKEINELEKKQQEATILQQEIKALNENDSLELQKAKEHNLRLDKEILALRQRVRSLDSERKEHMEQCKRSDSDSVTISSPTTSTHQDSEEVHKKCKLQVEEKECVNKQLLHKLQKLQNEYDEIVERNEELESILGESQNRTKEQVDSLESEIAGLQRTIINLEAELTELVEQQEAKEVVQGERSHLQEMTGLQQELEILRAKLKAIHKDLKDAEQEKNDLRTRNEQLEREKHLQDSQISELMEHTRKTQVDRSDQKSVGEMSGKQIYQQLEKVQDLENEKEQLSIVLSENKKRCEILQRQIFEGTVEKKSLSEENLQLRQEVVSSRHDLQAKREETSLLKQELADLQDLVQRSKISEDKETGFLLSQNFVGDSVIQNQHEEIRQLRQDLHRVQKVCSSAEKELRYERDKTMDVKKQNILLQKENTQLVAELNQLKQKLASVTAACSGLEVELDQRRQKIKEMELEMLKITQNSRLQNNLQEKLEHEKSRSAFAEKKVLELQQQLNATEHQLQLLETQMAEKRQLEDEIKNIRAFETKLKAQLQDEQLRRKVLEQSLEEFQQELKSLHENEMTLTQSNCTLQLKIQQLEAILKHLDGEKNLSAIQRSHCENTNQKLSEELLHLREEKESLHKEYDNIRKQLDDYIRKYNEKQLRFKVKLSRAKEVYLNEVNQRDLRIKELEMELQLSRIQTEKEQQWISKILAENDNLLREKTDLLQKMNEYEATDRSQKWKLQSAQYRVRILDEENKQLQESLPELYSQIRLLERMIKKLQSLNVTDISEMIPECLLRTNEILHMSNNSSSSVMFQVIENAQLEQSTEITKSLSRSETSDVGYLNVTLPGDAITPPEQSTSSP